MATTLRVAPVALVVTSVSRGAVRQALHSTSRLFHVPKCIKNALSVSCRVVRWHNNWNLGLFTLLRRHDNESKQVKVSAVYRVLY